MKLDRLQEYFTVFCVTIVGVLFGIYCGQLGAMGNMKTLGYIAAGIVVTLICLLMKTNIWLLIPVAWDLKRQSYLLPLPFGLRDVFTILVFGMTLVYTALKLIRKKPKYDFLDLIMGVNILYLLSVYLRNPVGFNSLGNDMVGGKPYYLTVIALMGYWAFSRVTMSVKQARRVPIMILISTIVVAVLSLISYEFPVTVPVLSHIYSGVETSSYNEDDQGDQYTGDEDVDPDAVSGRIGTLLDFGLAAVAILCSFYPPITLVNPLYFGRFLVFGMAWIAILYSGHRTGIFLALSFVVISSYFRSGLLELFRMGMFFVAVLLLGVMGNGTLFTLPVVAQRTLSFLPGRWDPVALENAQASTEWRIEMWSRAINGNKYIRNKTLGDGFGTSQRALDSAREMAMRHEADASMESQLVNGGFHSGPLSTVRVIGVVGLVMFYIWMVWLSWYAIKLIIYSKNTPYFPIALFFGVSVFMEPLYYTFIFGGFDGELPQTILHTGMLKLIYDSIVTYKANAEEENLVETTRIRKALGETHIRRA